MKFLIINGPNINMLGRREPAIYGAQNYASLLELIKTTCEDEGIEYEHFQSNYEGAIVDKIQSAIDDFDGIVINPAAYTHTSVAILDALKAVALPTVEIHISDIDTREEFRHFSYVSLAAVKTIKGLGLNGYAVAIRVLKDHILQIRSNKL